MSEFLKLDPGARAGLPRIEIDADRTPTPDFPGLIRVERRDDGSTAIHNLSDRMLRVHFGRFETEALAYVAPRGRLILGPMVAGR